MLKAHNLLSSTPHVIGRQETTSTQDGKDARNKSEALGNRVRHLRRRWASAAVRETTRVLLYRRRFVDARGDPGHQAGFCRLAT